MRNCSLAAVVSIFIGMPALSGAAQLTCSSEPTLDALVTCIRNQMPGNGSNGFVIPTATQQNDWRWTVGRSLIRRKLRNRFSGCVFIACRTSCTSTTARTRVRA